MIECTLRCFFLPANSEEDWISTDRHEEPEDNEDPGHQPEGLPPADEVDEWAHQEAAAGEAAKKCKLHSEKKSIIFLSKRIQVWETGAFNLVTTKNLLRYLNW